MADDLRRFLRGLSAERLEKFLASEGVACTGLRDLKPLARVKTVVDGVLQAPPDARARVEVIAGNVLSLADLDENAELALRRACRDEPALLEILESEASLVQRILDVWSINRRLLDRARNLALALNWQNSRYHTRYEIAADQRIKDDIEPTVEAIRAKVQAVHGGRKVTADAFLVPQLDPDDASDAASGWLIHHIAIYLEAPARSLMEFVADGAADETSPTYVLRRRAKEISVQYNPKSGQLDVSGKGVGGPKALEELANVFGAHAFAGEEIVPQKVKRREWQLKVFVDPRRTLDFAPPKGFWRVRPTEIHVRSTASSGARGTFRCGEGQVFTDYLTELGISRKQLEQADVSWVLLTFDALPDPSDGEGNGSDRFVQVKLTWPSGVSFEGVQLDERDVLMDWIDQQEFAGAYD